MVCNNYPHVLDTYSTSPISNKLGVSHWYESWITQFPLGGITHGCPVVYFMNTQLEVTIPHSNNPVYISDIIYITHTYIHTYIHIYTQRNAINRLLTLSTSSPRGISVMKNSFIIICAVKKYTFKKKNGLTCVLHIRSCYLMVVYIYTYIYIHTPNSFASIDPLSSLS